MDETVNGARTTHAREWLLVGIALALLAAVMALDPIPQDPAYHAFADRRAIGGIPNFWNVASNLAFLAVGIAGLVLWARGRVSGASISWAILFLGAMLVAAGSAYYHWAPDSATLVWDRLPMTIGFMGLFVALLAEHIDERLERIAIVPALVIGAASVAWWRYADDLRFYAWVQFMPLVILLLLIAFYRGRYTHRRCLAYGLACYVLAKVAEALDRPIFEATGQALSGHALKHLLAAAGLYCVYRMLAKRERVPSPAVRSDA